MSCIIRGAASNFAFVIFSAARSTMVTLRTWMSLRREQCMRFVLSLVDQEPPFPWLLLLLLIAMLCGTGIIEKMDPAPISVEASTVASP